MMLFDTGVAGNASAYSDRMTSWNHDKFHACMGKLNNGKGEMSFHWGDSKLVTAFMQDYYDDPKLEVTRVVEMCNASSGYPVWLVVYKMPDPK